ncbi:MAG: hypothetical protein IIB44_11810 [Candidatus Marinimicrobia bacterium]|nr:hypothetical protein [Candidatus Neomarinimicrobiota bacterium]
MNRLLIKTVFVGLFSIAMLSCQKQAEQQEEKIKLKSADVAAHVKDAITLHIKENTNAEDYFNIQDDIENRSRQLKFGYVHSSVHETDDGRYYACVDFTEAPDNTLDLDFYVTLDSDGNANVSEVVIHKINGVSRL